MLLTDIDLAIAIPVRNEAERLPRMLRAFSRQHGDNPFTLCLFFDRCEDGSMEIATQTAARLNLRIRAECCDEGVEPNAGRARGRAMALALQTAPQGVLMTSDADSEVAPDWIVANLAALEVADVAAGRVACDAASALQGRIERYYDRLHSLRRSIDPVPWEDPSTHHWTSGASLALRAATYRQIGGFPTRPSGEDAALCDAAARAGFRLRRDSRIVVHTSSRRSGRAEKGFAASLASFDRADHMPTTPHPEDEVWRFARQADARRLHGSGAYTGLAARLGLPIIEVGQVARECRNGEAFGARIVGAPPGGMRMIALRRAEALLPSLGDSMLAGAA